MYINNIEYKKQNTKIGIIMLIFFGASSIVSLVLGILQAVGQIFTDSLVYEVAYELVYSALYFCMFFIPMLFYKKFDREYRFSEMPCKFKFSRHFPLILLAALAINYVASYINAIIIAIFGLDMSSLMLVEYPNGYHAYHFVLDTIKIAIIPAFCEELLFRGLILDRLHRFGRAKAIFISALLFALMHQNVGQLFYTFILGLVLGYIVVESGSIWGAIVVHFVNNFTQVILNAVMYTQHEARANFIIAAFELAVVLLGAAAAIYYYFRHGRKKLNDPEWLFYTENELSYGTAIKGFFRPTMIIFIAISVVSMIGTAIMMLFL